MGIKDVAQLVVSAVVPFIAAGGALALAAFQRRERIACVITYGTARGADGSPEEASFLSIHNLTGQSVAISRVRYLSGIPLRARQRGTALEYEEPFDLAFPYLVEAGRVRNLQLQEAQALRLAEAVSGRSAKLAQLLRRPRIVIETTTTTGLRRRISAESVLDWKDRAPWARDDA